MLVGTLSPSYLRQTYLRGITLGGAWSGPGAETALANLLQARIEDAQGKVGVRFMTERVLTSPDTGKVLGVDYEIAGDPIPYEGPLPGSALASILLPLSPVQSIQRVRLFDGVTLRETVPATQLRLHTTTGMVEVESQGPLFAFASASWPSQPGFLDTLWMQGPGQGWQSTETWAVDYTVGLGRIPFDVADWICLGVAITVLSLAGTGTAISHGLAAESLRQDDIEERVEYARGKYGPYSGAIESLQQRLDAIDVDRLRIRYQGIKYPTW